MRGTLLIATVCILFGGASMALHGQPEPTTRGQVEANGIRLYYEIYDIGPPLILIEGLGVATYLWENQIPDFARHFTTVVYDNRGVGQSDKPEGPYSIAMMADDLAGLMQALNIPRAHILGVSMGGFIAQEFALRYPERVDRLVLVSTSAGGADHVPMSEETLQRLMAANGDPRELIRSKLALAYSEAFMQSDPVERLIDQRLANPQPPHAFMAQVAAGSSFDRSQEVRRIQARCLIAAATEDLLVPVANAHNLAKKLPNSEIKIYEGLGHQFFVEIPERFNQDVINFLTGQ